MPSPRPAAVAGAFYPGSAALLRREIHSLLTLAAGLQATVTSLPKAMIVPHAGYRYSGAIAASAYHAILAGRAQIKRVVLLGPAHRVALRGLALPGADAFITPLGKVPIDAPGCAVLRALPQVTINDAAHALEHALEVQLPFLQIALKSFTLLPLVVGDASAQEVAQVLTKVWGGPETVILISSDLSHYLSYAVARDKDTATVAKILAQRSDLDHEEACGATPINGLTLAAQAHQLRPQLLDLRNSADTAGEPHRVVGYAALAFYAEQAHAS